MDGNWRDRQSPVMRDEHIHLSPHKNELAEPADAKKIPNGGPLLLERHWTPLLLAQQTSKPFSNENGAELIALSKRALFRVKFRSNEGVGSKFTVIFN